MKKYISLVTGVFLMFGNEVIGDFFGGTPGQCVSLGCILVSAILIAYTIYEWMESEKVKQEAMLDFYESMIKQMETSANQENQTAILEEQKKLYDCISGLKEQLMEVGLSKEDKVSIANMSDRSNEISAKLDDMKQQIADNSITVSESLNQLNSIPKNIFAVVDELIEKCNDYMHANEKLVEQLCEDVADENLSVSKKIKSNMEEIVQSLEEYESKLGASMMDLSQQYKEFQKMTETIVQQLTMMSEKDYDVMKGLLNG